MKKLLFLLSIFAIILSCSSDETSTPVLPPPAPIVKYIITLSAGEGGTVSTTGGEYEEGQTVSVTASPQGEYLFKDWSDGNTDATRTITVSSNSTLTANFEKRKYPLTINFEGEDEVLEEIVNSGRTTEYDSGTTVKLTAQAAAEWVFVGWTGAIESTEESVQIVIGEPKEVTATFEKKKYPLTVNIEGEGEVIEEIIEADRTTDYDSGTTVKLTAEPADEWLFAGWSGDIGDIDPTKNPIQLNINNTKSINAVFQKITSILVDKYGIESKGLQLYLNKKDVNGRACVNCHLSPTGADIVQFGKSSIRLQDSIVVKRATEHVSLEDAYHIAAYLKKLNIESNDNKSISALIGIDNSDGIYPNQIWNGNTPISESEINNWDFRNGIKYSFEFPRWFKGDETNNLIEDNLDWIPEVDLLSAKGTEVKEAFNNYLINPTKQSLKNVLQISHYALSEGERNPGEHGFNNFNLSFDYQRWLATLYMQHVVMPNSDLKFGEELDSYDISTFSLADGIWDVGNIARRSQDNGSNLNNGIEIKNRLLNEVQWLYLGWITNYGKRNSFETQYIGTALKEFGEQDLASMVILKSLVSRSDKSQLMYDDIFTMGYITSDNMFYESIVFGLDFLIEGIKQDENHFVLDNEQSIQLTKGNLKDSNPNLKMFVSNKDFLSSSQKDIINEKINLLYELVNEM